MHPLRYASAIGPMKPAASPWLDQDGTARCEVVAHPELPAVRWRDLVGNEKVPGIAGKSMPDGFNGLGVSSSGGPSPGFQGIEICPLMSLGKEEAGAVEHVRHARSDQPHERAGSHADPEETQGSVGSQGAHREEITTDGCVAS